MNPNYKPKPTQAQRKKLKLAAFIFTWMENYQEIRTKDGGLEVFTMNTIQVLLAMFVAFCWLAGLPVLLMLPKSRQLGSSTFWQLFFFALAELPVRPGYRTAVVAHDEAGAKEVFSRAFTCLRRLRRNPAWEDPRILTEQAGQLGWEDESGMQSATIKTGDAVGRGGTPSAIHFSESASYSDKGTNAKQAVTAIMNALAMNEWAVVVHESTAKGKDPYFFPKCELARDPQSHSAFRLIFLPWFLERGYRMSWENYRKGLVASGKQDPGPTFLPTPEEIELRDRLANTTVKPSQVWWRWRYRLDDDQLIWRRHAIANRCENDPDRFRREYPSTYEEAFTASASCFWKPKTISYYTHLARPPQHRGFMHEGAGTNSFFTQAPLGPVKIWELPIPGTRYAIGADTGGEHRESDYYSAYVVDTLTSSFVAHYHGHFEWDEFALGLECLGYFYNTAKIVPENNHRPAVCKFLHRRKYPKLHYYFEEDTKREKEGRTPGYNMNVKTRKVILSLLKRAFRDKIARMPDPEFPTEMADFVWVPKANATNPAPGGEGTYKALGNGTYDDRVISAGLALTECALKEPSFDPQNPPQQESAAFRWFKQMQKDERARAAGESLVLGVRPPRAQS